MKTSAGITGVVCLLYRIYSATIFSGVLESCPILARKSRVSTSESTRYHNSQSVCVEAWNNVTNWKFKTAFSPAIPHLSFLNTQSLFVDPEV